MEEDYSWKECDSAGHSLPLPHVLCFGKPRKGHLEISVASGTPQVALAWSAKQRWNQTHCLHTCPPLGRGNEGMPKHQIWAGNIFPGIQLSLASLTAPLRLL